MGLLINLLDDISKQQYVEKGKNYLNCTKQGITSEQYRIPNNAKDSATYLWGNLLQTKPCDDMHTFIVTFIPQNSLNSVVRVRFSNHPCGPLLNWKKYETIGEPNKRIDIYFYNGKDSNIPTDSNENNLINNAHLYSDEDIAKLCMALSNLFLNGTFVHPFISQQPIQENNNKQINTNKNMKINESQLRKIIQESINGILNEITSTPGMGWMGLQFEEDDWTPVNEPNEGDACYKIKLWCGSGYHLDAFKVYAEPNDYETALEILVAYFDRENINTYFVDDWVEEEMEDLREKGVSEDDLYEELSKSGDFYIDATMEGASKPHWLRGENLQIQAFPLKENKKNNKHRSSINEGGYSKLERDIDGKTLLDGAVIRRLRKMAEQIDYISSMSSDKMQDVCSDLLNVFWKHKIY